MITTAGIDIGSMTGNAVILGLNDEHEKGTILSYAITHTGADTVETAKRCLDLALDKTDISGCT